ncbi:MAG: helix-hairpin-helix domain-containing protein, partial [Fusobacteriaceae bacterium]
IKDVSSVVQRFEMVYRIKKELKSYVVELGLEGRLINLQMQELLLNIKEEKVNFIKDYYNNEKGTLNIININTELEKLTDIELLELEKFSGILGHGKTQSSLDNRLVTKGYRVLGKISKLNKKDVEKLITIYDDLSALQEATEDELSEIKGISKFKIKAIKNGLKRLKSSIESEK